MKERIGLLDLTYDKLVELLAGWGEPRYRAEQVWQWLYQRLATDPAQMTNLPRGLRERLAAETFIDPLTVRYEQVSSDGQTYKWLFALPDGLTIETVLMLYPDESGLRDKRRTVCISSQAGCAMGCPFCATGQAGLARNLTSGEIVGQVLAAARWLARGAQGSNPVPDTRNRVREGAGEISASLRDGSQSTGSAAGEGDRLTNIVVMGMGEPMANYERVWQALRTITDKKGFNLGARHITVSTVGLVHGIRKMADEPLQINLAVSLHAPNDTLRQQVVPIDKRYPLDELMGAVRDYIVRTHRRVTFEYALMNGINDTPALAHELANLLRGVLCHVNLIPLNPVAGSPFQPSTPEGAATFQSILEAAGIPTTMRLRRGIDIDAGCGQLRRRVAEKAGAGVAPVALMGA